MHQTDGKRTLDSAVAQLARNFSIEILPKDAEKIVDGRCRLPAGTRVYIAFTSGSINEIIKAAEIVSSRGLVPVPHLPARRFHSHSEFSDFVRGLTSQAQVKSALLIAGDIHDALGPFASSLDVLKTGLLEEHGIKNIGFAGHPEGHPDVPQAVLQQALVAKCAYAAKAGMTPYLLTQLLFDTAKLFEWQRNFVEPTVRGLPIDVGFPGFAKITTLMRFAKDCGVGTSFSMLTKHAGKAFKLASAFSPDEMLSELASGVRDAPGPTFRSVHLYPFGSLERTAEWLQGLQSTSVEANETRKSIGAL